MPDDADRAQRINEEILSDALAGHARRQGAGGGVTHCTNCGNPIPQQRREVAPKCTRCIPCQQDFELLAYWR